MPTRADLIKQAEVEEAIASWCIDAQAISGTPERRSKLDLLISISQLRAAALRALAGDEWVEAPRLD